MADARTPHNIDSRVLGLVSSALAGVPEDVIKHHLNNGKRKEAVHWAVNKVLVSTNLERLNRSQFEMLLRGISITFPPIKIPEGKLAEDEPISRKFPNGWYMILPSGVDLMLLHQAVGQFDAQFYGQDDPWFLKSYGEKAEDWSGAEVERIPTETLEVFIPDPSNWLIPNSKGTSRTRTIKTMEEFGATLPEGWECPVPSEEELVLTAFEYHRRSGQYPLTGWNYARCRNRCGQGAWLDGGLFGQVGWDVDSWDEGPVDNVGGLRWAVRRGKITTTESQPTV